MNRLLALLLLGVAACDNGRPVAPRNLAAPKPLPVVSLPAEGVTITDSVARVIPDSAVFDTLFAPNSAVTLRAVVTGNLTSPGTDSTRTITKVDTLWGSGTPRTIAGIDTVWSTQKCYRDHGAKGKPVTVCPPLTLIRIDTTWTAAVPPPIVRIDTTWGTTTSGTPGSPYPVTVTWRAERRAAGDSGVTSWGAHLAGSWFVGTAQAGEGVGFRLIASWVRGGDNKLFADTLLYAIRRSLDSVTATVPRDSVAVGDSVLATARGWGGGAEIDQSLMRPFTWASSVDTSYVAVHRTAKSWQVWLVGRKCTCDPTASPASAAALGMSPLRAASFAAPESDLLRGYYRLGRGGLFYSRYDRAGVARVEATIGAPLPLWRGAPPMTFALARFTNPTHVGGE